MFGTLKDENQALKLRLNFEDKKLKPENLDDCKKSV